MSFWDGNLLKCSKLLLMWPCVSEGSVVRARGGTMGLLFPPLGSAEAAGAWSCPTLSTRPTLSTVYLLTELIRVAVNKQPVSASDSANLRARACFIYAAAIFRVTSLLKGKKRSKSNTPPPPPLFPPTPLSPFDFSGSSTRTCARSVT